MSARRMSFPDGGRLVTNSGISIIRRILIWYMIQSIITTPVSVVNQMINNIQMGYPVELQEGWEVKINSLMDGKTESNFGGARVVDEDVLGAHSCQTGLHSRFIFTM